MPIRLLFVYGTRPEAVKFAPLVLAARVDERFATCVVDTGQHPDLVKQIHGDFGITPDVSLDSFSAGQGLDSLLARVVDQLSPTLGEFNPDLVMVLGDTASCLGGALSGFHAGVPVGHVEAGMRSGHRYEPFPEETYRRILAPLASLHFPISQRGKDMLLREGIDASDIHVVGSTAIDALAEILRQPSGFEQYLERKGAGFERLVIVTCHRRESWGAPMTAIGQGLAQAAAHAPDALFVVAAHPNPKVRESLLPPLASLTNVRVDDPFNYRDFAHMMAQSDLLVTDSGGIQVEATSLGLPALVLRDRTEYTEAVDSGAIKLVGTSPSAIASAVAEVLEGHDGATPSKASRTMYGDGRSTLAILDVIASRLGDEQQI